MRTAFFTLISYRRAGSKNITSSGSEGDLRINFNNCDIATMAQLVISHKWIAFTIFARLKKIVFAIIRLSRLKPVLQYKMVHYSESFNVSNESSLPCVYAVKIVNHILPYYAL